jgi:hypothetical protein
MNASFRMPSSACFPPRFSPLNIQKNILQRSALTTLKLIAALIAISITIGNAEASPVLNVPSIHINNQYIVSWNYTSVQNQYTVIRLQERINYGSWNDISISNAWSGSLNLQNIDGTHSYRILLCQASQSGCPFFTHQTKNITVNQSTGYFSQDIGSTGAAGHASYNNGIFTIQASGGDIWGTSDGFHYIYRQLSGNSQVTARILDVTNTDSWTKVGVMVRGSLAANAQHSLLLLRPAEGSKFQWRLSNGVQAQSTQNNLLVEYMTAPKYLRLRRQGQKIISYVSDDGLCWQKRFEQDMPNLAANAYYGIALTSHNYGVLATANATDFAVETNPPPINGTCPQMAYDGLFPTPTIWIEPPAATGTSQWLYTTSNPNPGANTTKCNAEDGDDGEKPARRRDGPDHPECLINTGPLAWTMPGYNTTSWSSGVIGFGAGADNNTINTPWDTDSLWLRKTFTLTNQQQKDNLMFYGKWSKGITIYINGVLATHTKGDARQYRYQGLKNRAREALQIGTNVIAVRVEAFEWRKNSNGNIYIQTTYPKYFDMGITTNAALANTHIGTLTPAQSDHIQLFADKMKEYFQEQGITGGALAIGESGQSKGSWVLGYKTPELQTPLANNSILRLASNDKVVTRALVVELINRDQNNQNGLKPDSKYFDYLQNNLGINLQLPQGRTVGQYMSDVTIDQLIQHRGGIPEVDRAYIDQIAFSFGVIPMDLEPVHLVQWIRTLDTNIIPGSEFKYSSNGHFLLRFLANEIIKSQGKTMEQFLEQEMGIANTIVSYDRVVDRDSREPGYFIQDELHDRHVFMENYFAFAMGAESFVDYTDGYHIDYELQNGTYVGHGHSHTGSMDGTTSLMLHDTINNRSLMMNTSLAAKIDELSDTLGRYFWQPECSWGIIENPINSLGSKFFRDQYLNQQTGLASSPIATRGWVSARWTINSVPGTSYYTIINDWDGLHHLYMDTFDNNKLKVGSMPSGLPANAARWRIEVVAPENPGLMRYRIRNAHNASYYLSNEDQGLDDPNYTSSHKISLRNDHQNHWHSSQWMFCQVQ